MCFSHGNRPQGLGSLRNGGLALFRSMEGGPGAGLLETRLLVCLLILSGLGSSPVASGSATPDTNEPPVIPLGYDALLQWSKWPVLRIGVRAILRSTFDRTGGNHFADAAHFIRQLDDDHSVALDEAGPGILWFVRHNHWHGSPWHYIVDGHESIVSESSTADPTQPVANSVFLPETAFPQGLTYTWSVTRGADLSWVPIPFERHLELGYGRTRYGTGYFILWKLMPGLAHLSQPLRSWSPAQAPPREVLHLLDRAGTDIAPKSPITAEDHGEFSLEPYASRALFDVRDEARVVRRIGFEVPESAAEAFQHARLRIWWDDWPHPSVDSPVGLFFGTASLMRDPDQEFIVRSLPMTVRYHEGAFEFATYFPMPFLRSARATLSESSGQPLEGVHWSIRTEPYEGPANAVGKFHATYHDFPNPLPGRDLVLLDTTVTEGGGDWSGHIVGTTYQFTARGRLNTLEGDPRFYFDDSCTPQGQGTGSEEWGGGGDYWGGRTMTLPFVGHPVGRPPAEQQTALDRVHSAYRFLLTDLLPFGRNARITLEHGGENLSTEHYATVTYWYGLPAPSLILTDEFDVGEASAEARHNYRSPDASPPETVASRFEWGVDHVPLARGNAAEVFPAISDDGRHTRTGSEFTLNLDPANLGVLLRRRLDLRYSNQRARVMVADVGSDDTWKEAGDWYTAGGNPAVFGDPLGLPKDQVHGNPELAPPAHIPWPSNRRWREDEFMIPRQLTEGRSRIRIRIEFQPVGIPLFPGASPPDEAWTEFRYRAYSFVMPRVTVGRAP